MLENFVQILHIGIFEITYVVVSCRDILNLHVIILLKNSDYCHTNFINYQIMAEDKNIINRFVNSLYYVLDTPVTYFRGII